jgi:uncharacterized damage-inducible protein DinB
MNRMKMMTLAMLVLSLVVPAMTQTAPAGAAKSAITKSLDGQLRGVEGELVSAVEAMPDDKFDFAPTNGEFNGVRTFALQARHVATTNYWLYALMAGQKAPVDLGKDENGADTLKTKADIVKYVKDSYTFAHKTLAGMNEADWTKPTVTLPFGGKDKVTPLSVAVLLQGHQFDHYGQMVEYLRMNGVIPPASRPRQ